MRSRCAMIAGRGFSGRKITACMRAAARCRRSGARRKRVVVERFRPERHGEKYVLREWYFLGDRDWTYCETSDDPIFTSGDKCPELMRPVPEELRKIRRELGIDYGKMDFAFAENGEPVLYDVNKTTGVWSWTSLLLPGMIDTLAPGLFGYVAMRDAVPLLEPAGRLPPLIA